MPAMDEPPISNSPAITNGAGFGIRAAARVIDTIYGLVVGLFGGVLAGIVLALLEASELVTPGWQNRMGGFQPASWFCSLLGTLIYQWLTEGVYGASLGKVSCGLRVVSEAGQAIGSIQAFKRSLAYYWDALFFGAVAYTAMKQSELNQRHGDRWAKTIVVKSRDVPAASRRGWELFVLALVIGSVLKMICFAFGVILDVR